ncbi:MAG: hypothetical protein ACRD15_16630, partial [Vicinamibacterales bacterium]
FTLDHDLQRHRVSLDRAAGGCPDLRCRRQTIDTRTTTYPLLVMMMSSVRAIAWDDTTEAIPAFLTIVLMPLTVSITDGLAFGCISYAVLDIGTGRAREAHWFVYLFAALFVARCRAAEGVSWGAGERAGELGE